MKHLKKFEKLHNLEAGDYVICYEESRLGTDIGNFINNNIGKYLYYEKDNTYHYGVKYENIPIELRSGFTVNNIRWFDEREILYYSKDKKELELKLQSLKYNL